MYEELVRKIRTLTAQKTHIGLETQAKVSEFLTLDEAKYRAKQFNESIDNY